MRQRWQLALVLGFGTKRPHSRALGAAGVPGGRLTRVGIAAGVAPYQQVPSWLERLDDNERTALSLLSGDPAGAAAAFAAGFEPYVQLLPPHNVRE